MLRLWTILILTAFGSVVLGQLPTTRDSSANSPSRGQAGTYRIYLCRRLCTASDSSEAVASGYLVLSNSAITLDRVPKKERRYLLGIYSSVARRRQPTACFTLTRLQPDSVAALSMPVGLSDWTVSGRSIEVPFFRSPDSGYTAYFELSDGVLKGTGEFWSGNEAQQIPPEYFAGTKIGPADPSVCITAARRAQSR